MVNTLLLANDTAHTARAEGRATLTDVELATIRSRYAGAIAGGRDENTHGGDPLHAQARTLLRRFQRHRDMILRFTVNLDVPFTNNTAELPARSVKIQQRTSGGSWRTLQGLIDFAVVQSYLSTATKWGIDTLDAMTRLFTTGAWLPPALPPTSPRPHNHATKAEQLPVLDDGDVANAGTTLTPSDFGLDTGELEMIAGGPPCQPFSKAAQWTLNGRAGVADPRTKSLSGMLDLVEKFLPHVLLIENVVGFARGSRSARFLLHQRLEQINSDHGTAYHLNIFELDAANYGVAQHRLRANHRLPRRRHSHPATSYAPGQTTMHVGHPVSRASTDRTPHNARQVGRPSPLHPRRDELPTPHRPWRRTRAVRI